MENLPRGASVRNNQLYGYTVEIDTKNLDINACINGLPPKHREQVYLIRISVNTDLSPKKNEEQIGRDGLLITTPPRLNGLGIKNQSFQRIADPFIWIFILENSMDEEDTASPSCCHRHRCLPHHHHHQQRQRRLLPRHRRPHQHLPTKREC